MKRHGRAQVAASLPTKATSKVVMRVRFSSWLNGDLGRVIEGHLLRALAGVPGVRLDRLPVGLVVEARESPGVLVEHVLRAAPVVEGEIAKAYPVFVHELGGVWAGVYSVVVDPEVA